jgi:hypothetical protein
MMNPNRGALGQLRNGQPANKAIYFMLLERLGNGYQLPNFEDYGMANSTYRYIF